MFRRRFAASKWAGDRTENAIAVSSVTPQHEKGPGRRKPTLKSDGYTVEKRRPRDYAPGEDFVTPSRAEEIDSRDPFLPAAYED